jgi:hypothetical protein
MPRKLALIFCILLFSGCIAIHGTLNLSTSPEKTYLTPGEDINIISVDGKIVKIMPDGSVALTKSNKYAYVALSPGIHMIAVHVLYFDKGSVFFIETDLKKDRTYIVKYEIMKRISGLKWEVDVWVEDKDTGEKVGRSIKNL